MTPVFENLTPHPVVLFRTTWREHKDPAKTAVLRRFPVSGKAFRLEESDEAVGIVNNSKASPIAMTPRDKERPSAVVRMHIPIVRRSMRLPELPARSHGTLYIVSLPALMVIDAARTGRYDFIAPDTGPGPFGAVRDSEGNLLGVQRFVTLAGDLPQEGIWHDYRTAAEWETEVSS